MKFTVHGVLAGAYAGRNSSLASVLNHYSVDNGETALCKRVKPGNLADIYALEEGAEVTCEACIAKRGKSLVHACQEANTFTTFPTRIMPPWFLRLVLWIDDTGTIGKWPTTCANFQALTRRWHVLKPVHWAVFEFRVKRAFVLEARRRVPYNAGPSLLAINDVIALLDRAIAGEHPSSTEWLAAESAAWAAEKLATTIVSKQAVKSAASAAALTIWSAKIAAEFATNTAWAKVGEKAGFKSADVAITMCEKAVARCADKMHAEIFKLMTAEIEAAEQTK